MPGVHRKDDYTCGHDCFPPEQPENWSPNVKVNGKNVVLEGCKRKTHCCSDTCHDATYIGTSSVKVNGKALQRIGHPLSCGDTVCEGSSNVMVP